MIYSDLPCLPLIQERFCNAVTASDPDAKGFDLKMHMFPQVWGSTALGFGGWGGQSMTTAYTVVVDGGNGWVGVFFGNQLAYTICDPVPQFWADMRSESMAPVSRANEYRYITI